ncbi:MAG: alpha/beta hydrolase [Pseudomonadales bacterium]|nr:alpha/beta hydrolase [Pseudomonadales bacterium]
MSVFAAAGENLVAQTFMHDRSEGRAIIVHGYYDHAGLYGHLIRYCLSKKLDVYIFDLPGHGLSTGPRASIDSFDQYQQALDQFLALYCETSGPRTYLLGQSMGGGIVMEHLLVRGFAKCTAAYEKVVLFAPLVRPALWPMNRLAFVVLRHFIKQQKRSFSRNSHDRKFLEFIRQDPLQHHALPLKWVSAMEMWMKRFKALPASEFKPLVFQGKNDATVDWKYNLGVIENKFAAEIIYIDRARHHLVNEVRDIREEMFNFITTV